METVKYCDKNCNPESDVHSEECMKRWGRGQNCRYCCKGDDCMICGRQEYVPKPLED